MVKSWLTRSLAVSLVVLALAFAACGGDESEDDGGTADAGSAAERGPAVAQTSNLSIHDPFVPPPPADIAALYFTMVDLDGEGDRLMSVTTAAAGSSMLHATVTEGDTSRMLPIEGGLVLPPRGLTELAPGGFHVMLMNLTDDLEDGDTIEVTLEFERAGTVTIQVPVRPYVEADE